MGKRGLKRHLAKIGSLGRIAKNQKRYTFVNSAEVGDNISDQMGVSDQARGSDGAGGIPEPVMVNPTPTSNMLEIVKIEVKVESPSIEEMPTEPCLPEGSRESSARQRLEYFQEGNSPTQQPNAPHSNWVMLDFDGLKDAIQKRARCEHCAGPLDLLNMRMPASLLIIREYQTLAGGNCYKRTSEDSLGAMGYPPQCGDSGTNYCDMELGCKPCGEMTKIVSKRAFKQEQE
ncbi:unnamed protein product [Meganyctiphanes norvegica]|uniref:Uncharacterized protein n=1 Tax=Meganyctiphanes norvegica TaxID=48144 RepID=A0AAV2QQR8_MEGNR